MFYLSPEGDRYYLGRAFTYYITDAEGEQQTINYPRNMATVEFFESLGFTAVEVEQSPDPRFYTFSGPDEYGQYSSTPRDLDQVKLSFIMEQKRTARGLLTPSDWYVVRKAEHSIDIPDVWGDYRVSVRLIADVRCSQIAATNTIEELEALATGAEFIIDEQTGLMIENPGEFFEPWPTVINEENQVATGYGLDVSP